MDRVVLVGLSVLRWAAWLWMAAVLVVSGHDLRRPWLALALVVVAFAFTALATWLVRRRPDSLLTRPLVLTELVLAAALVVGDGWAYGAGHAFSTSQSLGSVWPLVAVLSTGVAFGAGWGAVAGSALGACRLAATLANGVRDFDGARTLSLVNTGVFYGIAGATAGYVALLLRRAEREISAARAREEMARTLHDGVLQTLAVVERRSGDPALARLAREQERELREYLFGAVRSSANGASPGDLGAALRAAASRCEDAFGLRTTVLVPDDVPGLPSTTIDALAGAVGEALTNAGKHARAERVTVFVEPTDDGGLFCSVKDDGLGFDADAGAGFGISQSIVGRMDEVGGRAEVRGGPGHGTEVCLWV